jgi:signal transduction histidine kinase
LRQILVNLIGNAVKYTDNGTIVVRTRVIPQSDALTLGLPAALSDTANPEEMWLLVQVTDSGIGIAPADQERIFEEFEQVGAGPRADSPSRGTGLGLAISRRLARLLGGDISLVSDIGRGSTFSLWLPIHEYDLSVSPQYASEPG